MANNLAEKYEPAIVRKFTQDSFLFGKTSSRYDFTGVRTIHIYGIVTTPVVDYTRSGTNRFGTPTELQDTVQEMTLSQDKSFTLTIDKGIKQDTMNNKNAGEVLKAELEEQAIPTYDKYAFGRFFRLAGIVQSISAPAVGTIVGLLSDALIAMDNALVPEADRYIYIGATNWGKLRLSTEYLACDPIAAQALGKGTIGTFMGYPVVKVPDSFFPSSAYYFLIARKQSLLLPIKFRTLRILSEVPGLDGDLLEGRHFYDAFVMGEICDGVLAAVNASEVPLVVTITPTTEHHVLTSAGSTSVKYTLDGSDPRWSQTAVTVAEGATVDLTDHQTIRCVAILADHCFSPLSTATYHA
jgi:hypothetical protein